MHSIIVKLRSVKHRLFSVRDAHMRMFLFVLLALWSGWQFIQKPHEPTLNAKTYDNLVRHRLFAPQPDPDILILDIDEATLAYMNEDFGRWPWPRDTLAATLDWLERQGAKAVVFDILFADADKLNKAADASFEEAIAKSKSSYFPVLRLNPDNDKVSEIKASQLKGFATISNVNSPDITLAVIPPLFDSAVNSARLGYHNVYSDQDGLLRHYRYWEDKQGWRIWSLPARMAQDLGWGLPAQAEPITNWNSERLAHTSIPFKDVWQLSQSKRGQTADARFANKIVIIGATATSLFDNKVTPVANIHPGVGILATVIDNVKNHRYLKQVAPAIELAVTLVALTLMFIASAKLPPKTIKWATLIVPTLLMAISFTTLHWGRWYLDLAGAASMAFAFFGAISSYRAFRLNHWSKVSRLGDKGLTQAWAICSSKRLVSQDLFNELDACAKRFCIQSLVWQRSTSKVDIKLLLVRISGALEPELEAEKKLLEEVFRKLEARGVNPQVITDGIKPFDLTADKLAEKKSGWRKILHTYYPTYAEHPFADLDIQLVDLSWINFMGTNKSKTGLA